MARLRGLALLASAAVLASACAATAGGRATGSGWITSSVDPTAKANFSFTFNCGKDPLCGDPQASGGYDDKGPNGARMKLVSVAANTSCDVGDPTKFFCVTGRCATAPINYESAEPKQPGSGVAVVTVCDNGHGANKVDDTFGVTVLTGPFIDYTNADRPLLGGQIKIILPPTP